jgi:hypothetical protein
VLVLTELPRLENFGFSGAEARSGATRALVERQLAGALLGLCDEGNAAPCALAAQLPGLTRVFGSSRASGDGSERRRGEGEEEGDSQPEPRGRSRAPTGEDPGSDEDRGSDENRGSDGP